MSQDRAAGRKAACLVSSSTFSGDAPSEPPHLRLVSPANNSFNRDYFGELPDGSENPMHNVFVKRGGAIHHFYGSEMGAVPADYGQHSRDGDSFWPLWGLLDLTPAGRGHDWMPALDY